ncbi:MAG: EFR1 family ferrodoxin [Eubacteriales bacterium]
MKILYFTASGNCLAVAKRFEAEYLSIPQMIKRNEYKVEDDAVGIVYPIYAGSIPGIVRRYLKHCVIRTDYLFVIATYGNAAGGSLGEMKNLLAANGNQPDYMTTLLMVDNYLPAFEMKDQVSKLEKKRTEENLRHIVHEVARRKKKDTAFPAPAAVISSGIGAAIRGAWKIAPRMYTVSDDCIGCGICARVCPVSNVSQKEKEKPVFGNHCESCFACVHNCPKKAIHLRIERSGERFRNPEVSLQDIIDSNYQG